MKQRIRSYLLCLVIWAMTGTLFAQKVTLNGHVKDGSNGETLIGVGVYLKGSTTGVVTNSYGFYSLSVEPGIYNVMVSYMGYETIDTTFNLNSNLAFAFEMKEAIKQLKEVVVKADRAQENVNSTKMSVVTLSNKTMKQIPVAFGEADILKTLVLLPGVKTNDEGGS